MAQTQVKMKRVLGFGQSYAAVFGCIISGTAMVALGNVAGYSGSGLWLTALIALIPMIAVACAYGELVSMIPGGGMVSDYTMPALGRFWAIFSILSGYFLLVTADGGTQLIIAGLTLEQLTGVPQLTWSVVLLVIVVAIHLLGVEIYGRTQAAASFFMVGILVVLGLVGVFDVTEAMGINSPVNQLDLLNPENGWKVTVLQTGAAIWWFIGFEFVCPTAEECIKPHRHISQALIYGVLTIAIVDVLFAFAAVKYTELNVLSTSTTPHVEAAKNLLGLWGFYGMSIITVLAAFTSAMAHLQALPRMLYGLAHKDLAPKFFTYLHPKFKTPWVGIFFTTLLITLTLSYIQFKGANVDVVMQLILIACTTWMLSYAIALIDVLVLQKRYPDFPRLTKYPLMKGIVIIGLICLAYCIWTLQVVWVPAGIALLIIIAYITLWLKHKKLPLFQPEPLQDTVTQLMERVEAYPEWDEAVTIWLKKGN